MACYAVIDTNVLVSALLSSHSNTATVLTVEKILKGEVIPVFSKEILEEYQEVLRRKKFSFSEETVAKLLNAVKQIGLWIEPEHSDVILVDMKDVPFYEVVLSIQDKEAYLVTGNKKHFPSRSFIVTAKEFIEILDYN